MVDKQVILNSSPEFKEIENHLAITWDSLDQVGQSWVNDFQKRNQKRSTCDHRPLSEDEIKIIQENFNKEAQIIYSFADYRTDTCLIIKKEIEALVFDKILKEFNLKNTSEIITVVDKSQLKYFDEKVDMTATFQQFVSDKILLEGIHNNSYFDICKTIFKKYKLDEKLSLKYSPSFDY